MSATLLYRIAAVLLILFAAGHTVGFLRFTPPTAEGVAVRDSMDNVSFHAFGRTLTYGGFYRGFGLFVTTFFLFSAFLAWYLGGLAGTDPKAIGSLGWVFVLLQLVSLVLSLIYFAPPPAVFSLLIAVCVGWAALLVQRTATAASAAAR